MAFPQTVDTALAACRSWGALPDPNESARVLAAEVERMRRVIRNYISHVEDGETFAALCALLPTQQETR